MRPDHDPFSGGVNLDDAGSVMRGIAQPGSVMRGFARPGSVAGLAVDPGTGLNFALVPYHPAGQARGAT